MKSSSLKSSKPHNRGKLRSEVKYHSGFKEKVVNEYLTGSRDQRFVASKNGISQTSLCLWIKSYLGEKDKPMPEAKSSKNDTLRPLESENAEIAKLKKQLEDEKLKNIVLEEMIDIAEDTLKISIRKKSGAKQ